MQVKGTLRCVIAVLLDKGRELNVDLLLLTSLYHPALHRREMKSHADPQVPAGSFRRQSKLSLQILRRLGNDYFPSCSLVIVESVGLFVQADEYLMDNFRQKQVNRIILRALTRVILSN